MEYQIEKLRASVNEQVRRQDYLLRFRDSITTKRQISTLREELETYFENISVLRLRETMLLRDYHEVVRRQRIVRIV